MQRFLKLKVKSEKSNLKERKSTNRRLSKESTKCNIAFREISTMILRRLEVFSESERRKIEIQG